MRKFNNRSSGRKGDGRFGVANKHRAVCDECGKDCEVPFKPSGDKPVYCSSCFEKESGDDSKRRDRRDRRGYDNSERRDMFSAVCAMCDKKCEIPFRPRFDKPVYCSSCFEKVDPNRESRDTRDSKGVYEKSKNSFDMSLINDQLISINAKLEKLIKVLVPIKEDTDKEKEIKVDKIVTKKVIKKPKSIVNESVAEKKPVKKKLAKKESVKKVNKTVTKKKKSK